MFVRLQSKSCFFKAFCIVLLASTLTGQVNLWGQEGEHPVVSSIKRNPPRSPIETARAILYLSRINQWKELGVFVDQIPKIATDPAVSLAMVRAAGLETWLKLSSPESPLTDNQKVSIKEMLDRASKTVTDDATLKKAIQNLSATELVDKKRGALAIQAAGPAGLRALIESAIASETPLPSIASEVIVTFRDEGKAALKAAMNVADPQSFERLLELAAKIPGTDYLAELSTGLFVTDPQSSASASIEKRLSPTGEPLPTQAAVARTLLTRLKGKVNEYRIAKSEQTPPPISYWLWRANEKRLDWKDGTPADNFLAEAASLASLILRIPSQNSVEGAALANAVLLEQAYQESGLWMVESPAAFLNGQIEKQNDTPEFLLNVLEVARREQLLGAELRATQILGQLLDRGLKDPSRVVQALTRLSKDATPATRYAAVQALYETIQSSENVGLNYGIAGTRAEMMKLESNPLALIIGGSSDLRDTLASQLSVLQIRSENARNAREAIRMIQEPHPYEMIFIVDRVADMSLSEFVQRLRAAPRTATLPIVIMASQWTSEQQRLADSEGIQGIFHTSLTENIGFTSAILQDVQQNSKAPKLDSTDRVLLRSLFDSKTTNAGPGSNAADTIPEK
jgi:CheY-like chemotaxis protein